MFLLGQLGLIEAAKRFDLKKEAKFLTYAAWYIDSYIRRDAIDVLTTVRIPAHVQENIRKIIRFVPAEKACAYSDAQVAFVCNATELPEKDVRIALDVMHKYMVERSLNRLVKTNNGKDELINHIPDEKPIDQDVVLRQNMIKEALQPVMKCLTKREKLVICLRFGLDGKDEKSLEAVGDIVGVTRERVRQIELRALRKMHGYADKLEDYLEEPVSRVASSSFIKVEM
jgi:RNA polymerase primary sigma factor